MSESRNTIMSKQTLEKKQNSKLKGGVTPWYTSRVVSEKIDWRCNKRNTLNNVSHTGCHR